MDEGLKYRIKTGAATKWLYSLVDGRIPGPVSRMHGRRITDKLIEKINRPEVITVIGRGSSGTRLISGMLRDSGVFMGEPLNPSEDLIPPEKLYKAMRLAGGHVRYKGNYSWDYTGLLDDSIDSAFYSYFWDFLSSVLEYDEGSGLKGWKIPETMLFFPWMVRLFPDMKYIYWVRDPRDVMMSRTHLTDRFEFMNVPFGWEAHPKVRSAASWKYHWDLMQATPKPKHFIMIRYEDFVNNQNDERARLEAFLGVPLAEADVNRAKVGMWKNGNLPAGIEFLDTPMKEAGYMP